MTSRINGTIWRRRLIAGIMTWLILFLVAIPLYGSIGTLLIDEMLFKSP